VSSLATEGVYDQAYLPVLDEPPGLVDPASLRPGPHWWHRPNASKHAPKEPPPDWKPETGLQKKTRFDAVRQMLTEALGYPHIWTYTGVGHTLPP
jgi:hypothetical protein